MKILQTRPLRPILLAILLLFGLSGVAHAVDGVRLITQARALAGNVTPGDAPGFPVTISRSGSYRLATNLLQTDTTTDCPAAGLPCVIEITSDNATLDLNGFSIEGVGTGVASSRHNITVRNGIISLPPAAAEQFFAVRISGSNSQVSDLSLTGCGLFGACIIVSGEGCTITNNRITSGFEDSFGIEAGANCLISSNTITNVRQGIRGSSNSTITRNTIQIFGDGDPAIRVLPGSVVLNNVVTSGLIGIQTIPDGESNGSMIRGNTVRGVGGFALMLGPDVGYGDNVLTGNNAGQEVQVSGGVDLGGNLCGTDATCP